MSDIITRLLLKTNDFDANLEKSKGSVNSFQSGIANVAQTAGSGIMKFAGTIGLAMEAFETFDKLIHSSQGTQDAFEWHMAACKETVDAFFHSLSSGDFSAFNQGIASTYDNMLRLQQLRDDFADAKISNNVFRAQYQMKSQELKAVISDNTSSKAEKQKAADELKKITEAYAKQLSSTNDINVAQMMQNAQAKTGRYFGKEDIIRFFKVYNNPASIDDRKGDFDSYASKMNSLKKKEYAYEVVNTSAGAITQKVANPEVQKQIRQLQKENNELDRMYLLSQHTDKTWEELSSSVIEYFTMQGEAAQNLNFLVKQQNKTDKAVGGKQDKEPEKDSIAWYEAEISKLNKKLSGTVDEQARATIQTTINELEGKKLKLQVETSGNSLESISIQLADLNKKLISETDMQARATIQATINELEQRKINLKFVVDQEAFKISHGEMKDGALSMPIKPTYDKIPTHGKNGKNFKLPKYEPIFNKKDIKLNNEYAESLGYIGNAFDSVGKMAAQFGNEGMSFALNSIGSIAQMIVQLQGLATANGVASAMSLPFPANLAAIATVVGAVTSIFASMPKFATGGIVPGVSFTGDKIPALLNSGEMILNSGQQSNLFKMLNSGMYGSLAQNISPSNNQEIHLSSNVSIKGDTLYLLLNNYMKRTGKRL